MYDLVLVALATVVPVGLVGLVAYKMITRKKRPELKLVETPVEEVKVADQAVKEVVAKAKKINKNKARRGKRRVKKN